MLAAFAVLFAVLAFAWPRLGPSVPAPSESSEDSAAVLTANGESNAVGTAVDEPAEIAMERRELVVGPALSGPLVECQVPRGFEEVFPGARVRIELFSRRAATGQQVFDIPLISNDDGIASREEEQQDAAQHDRAGPPAGIAQIGSREELAARIGQNAGMNPSAMLILSFLASTPCLAQFGPIERRVLPRLSATHEVGKLVIHYAPTLWMERLLPAFADDQKKAFVELEQRLGIEYEGRVHVFVYLDAAELGRLTLEQGVGAFSGGNVVHTPFSIYPQHELTHILCLQWNNARNDPVPRDREATDYGRPDYKFVVEGLADAMTKFGRGRIPIREWIAFYKKLDALVPLQVLRSQFPETGTRAPAYWIAGSFFEYLIETYGMGQVKRFYFAPKDMKAVFGKDLDELEAEWIAWLEETPIETEKMARALDGELAIFEKQITGAERDVRIRVTADDVFLLEVNGQLVCAGDSWMRPKVISVRLKGRDHLRVLVVNDGGAGGLLLDLLDNESGKPVVSSDDSWDVVWRNETKKAKVLGKPLSGAWGHFADEEARAALGAFRGSWIWGGD